MQLLQIIVIKIVINYRSNFGGPTLVYIYQTQKVSIQLVDFINYAHNDLDPNH